MLNIAYHILRIPKVLEVLSDGVFVLYGSEKKHDYIGMAPKKTLTEGLCLERTEKEGTLRRRFGQHAAAGFISVLGVRLLALLLVKILSNFLTKSDYGSYSLWLAMVVLISTFSTSPFSATLWRYLQKKYHDSPKDASKLVTQSFIGPLIIIVGIFSGLFVLFFLFGIRVIDDSLYLVSLAIVAVLTVFYILKEIILVISGSEQNSREIMIFNLSFGLISTAAASLLAIMFNSFLLALIGLTLGYSIPIFIALAIKLKQYRLARFSKNEFKEVTEFGGPMIIVTSARTTVLFIASLSVSIWIGMASVGTLNIALTIAVLPSFIIGPALTAYYAYMVNVFESSEFEKGNQVTTKVVEFFISLVTPLVWLIIAFSPFLIELISTSAYLDAVVLIPFTVLASIVLSLSQFWKFRLELAYKTYLAAAVYIVSFVVLISSLLFFQNLGLIGIGVAILLQALSVLIGMYIIGNRNIPITIRPFYLVAWGLSLIVLLVTDNISQIIGLSAMLAGILASGAYLICLVITRGLKIRDVKYVFQILLKKSE